MRSRKKFLDIFNGVQREMAEVRPRMEEGRRRNSERVKAWKLARRESAKLGEESRDESRDESRVEMRPEDVLASKPLLPEKSTRGRQWKDG